MGDRTTAYFQLGGKLTQEAYDELLELIEQESYIQGEDDVRKTLVEDERFDIWIDEANYARVDPFDDFAIRHGLAYHHWWAAGGGYGPGGVIYIPGAHRVEYESSMDFGPSISIGDLKTMTFEEIQTRIAQIEAPLPPLELPD
ncbi:hypothetical protein KNJ79_05085 [Sphingopyxis indica]|uniref:hypothetical protein n=1 Tax=Sphingopyxis indica TaxID=436663 RepID=UPI002939013F|nr:hypothetical protein [Sphingopyxis indica]WOF44306.1 hypothetical protein KNJ79_05085 [Sphingopyxis indica]